MYKYYIIILLLINIHFCKCLLLKQLRYIPIINAKKCNKKIIANLDDIIDYHYNKNIIELMTHILPLFINYNKIEFVISYNKINSLLKNSLHKVFAEANHRSPSTAQNSLQKEINTYIIINLGILAKKTNTEITIIYSKFPTTAIDYYLLLHLNANLNKIDILKDKPISLLLKSAISHINVMKFNKNDILYQSINIKPIDQNITYNKINITNFFA